MDEPSICENNEIMVSIISSSINDEKESLCPHGTHSDGRAIVPMSKQKIIKNLIILSISYLLFFLGFWALSNLESTINSSEGIGTVSQAIIYAVSMISSLFLSELIVKSIGCKKTFALGLLISCCYIAANMYVSWATLIPTSILYGLASGPLNTAQALYTEELAIRYSMECPQASLEHIMASFFGIFMIFSQSTQIFGNIASYFVLNYGSITVNDTNEVCGIDFRPGNDTNPNLDPPSDLKRYTLIGIYLLCGVLGVVFMGLFADPLYNDIEKTSSKKRWASVWSRVLAAVKLLRNPKLSLMIPLMIFTGMEGALYSADFTQAYIACSWGIGKVGFVSICFGLSGAVMSMLVGPLVKYFSQFFVFVLAVSVSIATHVTLYLWKPHSDHVAVYFVIAAAWGICDATWWSQIPAFFGLIFQNEREAAFSNFYFWSFFGYFLCYSYSNYLTVVVKVAILSSLLISGFIGYLLCQLKIKREKRS